MPAAPTIPDERKRDMSEQNQPTEGDTCTRRDCGMAILVTTDCKCDTDDGAFFSCCGEQLEKTSGGS